ncbi:MAG: PQQ-binding-like beta-propeller repeat protein [Candidatus Binatia bacterium]|nr:PQQ-binding-like beta-propeller repeat protein [Candidatus Binatia bacterium]
MCCRRNRVVAGIVVSLLVVLTACSSGDGVRCSFAQPARLANSSWPKFQRDLQNTGAIRSRTPFEQPLIRAQFRTPDGGRFFAGPVLGNGGPASSAADRRLYVGDSNGRMYALDSENLTPLLDSEFSFLITSAIRTTPLVAVRQDQEALFFGSELGFVYAVTQNGSPQPQVWPLNTGGSVGLTVALHPTDGTVYAPSAARALYGICPNGVIRFSSVSVAPLSGGPAVTPTGEVVYGGDDRLLRMERSDGFLLWAVSVSAPVRNAPVIELDESNPSNVKAIYALDANARLFKISPSGQLQYVASLSDNIGNGGPQDAVVASPALANGRLYVAVPGGQLVAVDANSGVPIWSFFAAGEIVAPPVVLLHESGTTVVFGSTAGDLHLVEDAGNVSGAVSTVSVGAPIRTPLAVSVAGPAPVFYVADDSGTVSRIE